MIFSDTGFVQQNAYYIFYLPLKLNSANKLALPVFDVCQSTKKKTWQLTLYKRIGRHKEANENKAKPSNFFVCSLLSILGYFQHNKHIRQPTNSSEVSGNSMNKSTPTK